MFLPVFTNRTGGVGSLIITSGIWVLILIGAAFPSRAAYVAKSIAQLNATLRILRTQAPKPGPTRLRRELTNRRTR